MRKTETETLVRTTRRWNEGGTTFLGSSALKHHCSLHTDEALATRRSERERESEAGIDPIRWVSRLSVLLLLLFSSSSYSSSSLFWLLRATLLAGLLIARFYNLFTYSLRMELGCFDRKRVVCLRD